MVIAQLERLRKTYQDLIETIDLLLAKERLRLAQSDTPKLVHLEGWKSDGTLVPR